MLGFDVAQSTSFIFGMLPAAGSIKSVNQAQLNSLQNILIKSDIVTGSYQNSQLSNIMCCLIPYTKRCTCFESEHNTYIMNSAMQQNT